MGERPGEPTWGSRAWVLGAAPGGGGAGSHLAQMCAPCLDSAVLWTAPFEGVPGRPVPCVDCRSDNPSGAMGVEEGATGSSSQDSTRERQGWSQTWAGRLPRPPQSLAASSLSRINCR